MSMSRAMRTLVFIAVFGTSHSLFAGDLRNLPVELRAYFLHRLIVTYGLTQFSDIFLCYFPQFGSPHMSPTEATQEVDDLWIRESQNVVFYAPVLITTSDLQEHELSPEEFIELQHQLRLYFPTSANAIDNANNQYDIRLDINSAQLGLLLHIMQREHPYEPIVITTSDNAEIYFSPEELIQLSSRSSILANYMDMFPILDQRHLPVTSALLNLFQRMIRATPEVATGILESYSQSDLETLQTEADSIKCGYLKTKIKRFLMNARRKQSLILPECPKPPDLRASDTELVRTRKSRAQTMTHVPISQMPTCSLASPRVVSARNTEDLTQEGKKQLRRATASLILPKRKAQPPTTESTTTAISTTTAETTAPQSPLEKAAAWSLDEKFQSLICYYYTLIATDAELATFLKTLDLQQEKHRAFAFALIRGFTAEGFPHKLEQTLIDEVYNVIFKLGDFVDGGTVPLGIEFSEADTQANEVCKLKKKFESAPPTATQQQKHWHEYEDNEIAYVWTFSDALTFCNMPPLIMPGSNKPDMKNKLSAMATAQNKYIDWLVEEIKAHKDKKSKTAFLTRLCDIAKIMLDIGNFNGAITIYGALLKDDSLNFVKSDVTKLEQIFTTPKHYHDVLNSFRELKSSRIGALLFYGSQFETRTSGISRTMESLVEEGDQKEIADYELEAAILIGQFLREMHLDQRSANYTSRDHPELVSFFMNITKS